MSAELGEQLMLWTIRASVACYVVALWRWLFAARAESSDSPAPDRIYRLSWTASWSLCIVHVICAFHFRHHWDHAVAIEHTAKTTNDVVGINWGGGLYINYVFLTVWGLSVLQTLRSGTPSAGLGRTLDISLHAFAAFMMFNATAVFGPMWWWLPTVAVMVAVVWNWKSLQRQPST